MTSRHRRGAAARAAALAVAALVAAAVVAAPAGASAASPSPSPTVREVPPCVERLVELGTPLDDPRYVSAGFLPEVGPEVAGTPLAAQGLLVDPAVAPPPRVPATSWLVADLDTGEVLAACNAHVPLAPASTIKVLTALALTPDLPGDLHYRASEATGAVGGSRVGIVPGSGYTLDDLLHGLWLGSGNDAAVAIAEIAGGEEAAVARMQEVARSLGATSTRPRTPHGLDAPGQVSTAHDLAVIGRAALDDPRSARLAATVRYSFPGRGATSDPDRPRYEIQTSGRLVRNVDGATGMKSGFTRAAGGSYIGTAERDGRRLVATVMRSQGRPWHHARDLLEWGYGPGAAAAPVATLATAPGEPDSGGAGEAGDAGDAGRAEDPAASRDGSAGRDGERDGEQDGEQDGPDAGGAAAGEGGASGPGDGGDGTAAGEGEAVPAGEDPAAEDRAAPGSPLTRARDLVPGGPVTWLAAGAALALAVATAVLALRARALGRR